MPTPQSFAPVKPFRWTITLEDGSHFSTSNRSEVRWFWFHDLEYPEVKIWDDELGCPFFLDFSLHNPILDDHA